MNSRIWALVATLVLLAATPIIYKTAILGVSFVPRVERNLWTVELSMKIDPDAAVRKIGFPIPRASDRVIIRDTKFDGRGMTLTIQRTQDGYIGHWRGRMNRASSPYYRIVLETSEKNYAPPGADETAVYPGKIQRYLALEELTARQLEQIATIESHIVPGTKDKTRIAKAIYYFVHEEVLYNGNRARIPFDEVLETMRADSWGKARLVNILCRRSGVPSRMVGGITLKPQRNPRLRGRRKLFFWNELYLDGKWKPVCATYGNFASLTAEYLPLFKDTNDTDEIVSDPGARLKIYANRVESEEFTIREYRDELIQADSWLLNHSLYMLPSSIQAVIKTLLLIPLGAVVLVFFRNIIGFKTFGIFMPVLLALFFKETSFLFGLAFFALLVLLGFIERRYLEKLHLLAVPRLSIILALVVLFLCLFSVLNNARRWIPQFSPSLFPVVITTIFIERFSIMMAEEGARNTVRALAGTLVISLLSYWLFTVRTIQVMLFTYPELLFALCALFILTGKYTGYRLTEFIRFREMLKERQ